jgi:hypothetical protein
LHVGHRPEGGRGEVSDKSWRQALVVATALVNALTTGPSARADTPPFPDLTGYAPVNVADYFIAVANTGRGEPIALVYFLTPNPDHLSCDIASGAAQCAGNDLPGIPPAGANRVNWIATDTGVTQSNVPIESGHKVNGRWIKVLPPWHSITMDGVICGVDNAHLTACKDPHGRGFVLSPRGSSWLPHV